jgi:hypothetical protein
MHLSNKHFPIPKGQAVPEISRDQLSRKRYEHNQMSRRLIYVKVVVPVL